MFDRAVGYGHTFNPTPEMAALPELLHGEAVAVDMDLSLVLAAQRDLTTPEELSRALSLIDAYDLPTKHPQCEEDLLIKALADATSRRSGLQRVPLSHGIGSAVLVNDSTRGDQERREIPRHPSEPQLD